MAKIKIGGTLTSSGSGNRVNVGASNTRSALQSAGNTARNVSGKIALDYAQYGSPISAESAGMAAGGAAGLAVSGAGAAIGTGVGAIGMVVNAIEYIRNAKRYNDVLKNRPGEYERSEEAQKKWDSCSQPR